MAAKKQAGPDEPAPPQQTYRVVGGSIVFHDRDTALPDSLVTLTDEEAANLLAVGAIELA